MFAENTVVILGAGSSIDFGMPLGSNLASMIKTLLSRETQSGHPPNELYGEWAIRYRSSIDLLPNKGEIFEAGYEISNRLIFNESIDSFIEGQDENPQIATVAKLAISVILQHFESESVLRKNQNNLFSIVEKYNNDWPHSFVSILFGSLKKSNRASLFKNVKVINFNYDRCFEAYLLNAMQFHFNLERRESLEILKSLDIIRPYGALGNFFDASDGYFGKVASGSNLLDVANGIKTFSEQVKDRHIVDGINQIISKAETIIFLGFGYHTQNIEVLSQSRKSQRREIYGTAIGVSDQNRESIVSELEEAFIAKSKNQPVIKIENKMNCRHLIDNYSRFFSKNARRVRNYEELLQ